MPRINRLRIVNFAYNHDRRHILDETFNFYGGENALLSLANGGGKSVLVQLILQPIVPGIKLQGRPMISFFKRRRLPAYVLLEWKLDGGGGHLLTGIALASQEVKGVEEDEKSQLKYFTFTVKYPQAHDFDLAHIPLVAREGGLLEIKPFREAAQLLAEKAKTDPVRFRYFSQDDGSDYAAHLQSFGIFQEEWQNVVARINDSESGLKEVFEKCRTSDQLLNTWLIKTVEKVLFRDQEAARQLEEMLANLVQEIIDNEQYILEKELVTDFLQEFGELSASLGELVNGLEEEEKLLAKLAAFHGLVTEAAKACAEEKEAKEAALEDCRWGLDRLLLEERSLDYHLAKEEYDQRKAAWEAAEEAKLATEGELNHTKKEIKRQEGARLLKERAEIRAALAALEEQLALLRQEFDAGGRLKSLEYSLKLGYEKLLAQLEENVAALKERLAALNGRQEELGRALETVDKDRVRLSTQQGQLVERIASFDLYQAALEKKLNCRFKRDLFRRLDQEDAAAIRNGLASRCRELALKEESCRSREKEGKDRLQAIGRELISLGAIQAERIRERQDAEAELDRYLALEGRLAEVFRRHVLDFRWRFNQGKVAAAFKEREEDLEKRKYAVIRERDRVAEALKALKQGVLHLPQELTAWLAERDIAFETGERYLLNQSPEIREQLLAQNPLLPFALVLTREDLARLLAAQDGPALRQAVPIITYQELSQELDRGARWVRPGEGLSLLCYYEGRMFEAGGLRSLVEQLTEEQADHERSRKHLEEALELLRQDWALAAGFDYPEDYRARQEKALVRLEASLEKLQQQHRELTAEQAELEKRLEELRRELDTLQQDKQAANALLQELDEFLVRNRDYELSLQQLEQVRDELKAIELRRTRLAGEEENNREELANLRQTLRDMDKELAQYRQKYRLVAGAAEAPLTGGSVAELEAKLEALKREYRGNLEQLETARKEKVKELEQKEAQLRKLGLPEEELQAVVYDEATCDRLEEELQRLERLLEVRREEASDAKALAAEAKASLQHALERVKELTGAEPLEPGEIRGNFEERRRDLNRQLRRLEKDRELLLEKINKYNRLAERVRGEVELKEAVPEPAFELSEQPEEQLAVLLKDYRQKREDNRSRLQENRQTYLQLAAGYRDKKKEIALIFAGLNSLWEQAGTGFAGCYYLYERTLQQLKMLQDLLGFYETRLANLERSKEEMVRQSYLHGLQIYEELHKISECSRVRIHGRSRPVEMLRIDMELAEGDLDQAYQRMKQYVEQCINIVRGDLRQGKKEEEVAKTINRLMSSRELLNQLLGTSRIPVQVFKIELNMQHSRHKKWDDAIKENSGGEKFVVFFSVLAAMMAYTRMSTMGEAGLPVEQASRVLVMDNPFGPISSEHLLQPLFDIAAKHNTQLICLSDLKQSSIMNCFNLIFMLRVRTGITGEKEYLQKEEIFKKENVLASGDENLEKALFRAWETTQITMFEEFEEYQPE